MRYDFHDLWFYCGQSDGSVMSKHYDRPSLERLGKIAALAQAMVGADG